MPSRQFFFKEIKLFSSCGYNKQDFEDVMGLIGQGEQYRCVNKSNTLINGLPGKFPGYETMVTDRISIEDVVSKGFEELVNNKDDHIKILVSPRPLL